MAPENHQQTTSPATAAAPGTSTATSTRGKSPHLMCGNPLWGVAGAAAAAYFAYLSYSHLGSADYSWPHTWWTTLTYAVWVVVIGGLLTETRCWRERIVFGLMLLIFLLGLAFSAWSAAPKHAVRQLRQASTLMWGVAALASLTTAFGSKEKSDPAQRGNPEGAK